MTAQTTAAQLLGTAMGAAVGPFLGSNLYALMWKPQHIAVGDDVWGLYKMDPRVTVVVSRVPWFSDTSKWCLIICLRCLKGIGFSKKQAKWWCASSAETTIIIIVGEYPMFSNTAILEAWHCRQGHPACFSLPRLCALAATADLRFGCGLVTTCLAARSGRVSSFQWTSLYL